ncbi:hypothetical protein QCM11_22 [Bacillus phage QCM11]|uniref:Uncharacterized protein n=1 Tax=Bacillus phage QCM11 TaxID=1909400 RepID=A0A1I9S6N7_9CAUD|nr:hypothetical protein H3008_gp22 [Bacillus phage QCM11]AOZ62231.1 hypothetical protein QCM11_22 [Bacillus phage QCM11]
MYKLICGKCKSDEMETINPDETKCIKCGNIHEKLSDYDAIQITDEYFENKKVDVAQR